MLLFALYLGLLLTWDLHQTNVHIFVNASTFVPNCIIVNPVGSPPRPIPSIWNANVHLNCVHDRVYIVSERTRTFPLMLMRVAHRMPIAPGHQTCIWIGPLPPLLFILFIYRILRYVNRQRPIYKMESGIQKTMRSHLRLYKTHFEILENVDHFQPGKREYKSKSPSDDK